MKKELRVLTIPNLLSLFRLLLLVPIMVCVSKEARWEAVLLMALGVATDFLDGIIARRFDQCSDLGRIIDPVIDKVNVLAVLLLMVVHPAYHFPLWFFIFLIVREMVLMICSLIVVREKGLVMESNRSGKNSAFANGMVVILFVLDFQPYAWIMLWIGFVLTLYSSWNYLRLFLLQMRTVE